MQAQVAIEHEPLNNFCRRWSVSELALFGSVLRADFRPDSDIDVLVSFAPEAKATLFDLVTMKEELERIFGRPVDLVTKHGIESSRNWIRRTTILDTAARLVVEWSAGIEKSTFLADRKTQAAIERQLEILGEATKRLSASFREQHPHIPWRQIAGLRDVLILRYDDVNPDLLMGDRLCGCPRLPHRPRRIASTWARSQ